MSKTTQNLVYAIASGNALATQNAFGAAMAEKLSANIDTMRASIAQSMFNQEIVTEASNEAKSLANDIASKHKNMQVSVERGNVMIHHKDDDEKIDRLTLSHTGDNKFKLHRTGSSTEDVTHKNLTADEVHKHAAKHIGGLQNHQYE